MSPHAPSARLTRTVVGTTAAVTLLLLAGCGALPGRAMKTSTSEATVTEAVTAVEITDARRGSVEVTPGSGAGVTVHRTVHYRGDTTPEPGRRVSDGTLSFTNGCGNDCWVDYRLVVPATVKVKIDGSSGDVSVTGVARAEVDTDSGDVRVERIAGPLKVRTSSGEIRAGALSDAGADIRTDSGDTTLDFAQVPRSVSVTSTAGDVDVTVPRAPYEVTASTTSGTRRIAVPTTPAAPSRLALKTTSGDVHVSTT
ncbi:DUF4097 family beta strand repeat-containing protein [Streptomyces sp. NPDC101733]|uniref:DUF4097 family beta strand repeat-containing protein n=1 Tax=unclassified Streptomyces TaxID=2593676 RepID=UPI0037F4DAFE